MTINYFINPLITPCNLDIYIIRKTLFEAVKQAAPLMSGILLDVGCGEQPYRNFILESGKVEQYLGLDLEPNDSYRHDCELKWDGLTIPLPTNSVNCAMATEVLEHCPEPDVVLAEIFRVLKPGGIFFFTIPFLWPLHDMPNDEYRYTPFAIARHLEKAGFHQMQLRSMGGWERSLGQMLGLYLRRRPMPIVLRWILSLAALPIIYLLDKVEDTQISYGNESDWRDYFYRVPMTIGISGIARKPML